MDGFKKYTVALPVGLALFLFVAPVYAQQRMFLSARDHLQIGDTPTAIRITESLTGRYPQHHEIFLLHSALLYDRSGEDRAVKFLKQHVTETRSTKQIDRFIESLTLDDQTKRSILRWALSEGLTSETIYGQYASLLNKAKQWKKSRSVLVKAIEQFPNSDELEIELIKALLSLGKLGPAGDRIRELIRAHPGDRRVVRLRTIFLLKSGAMGKAKESYERLKAVSDEPIGWSKFQDKHS